ncbi:helix-turn-helix domain-containing protein [Fulvivirga lutimaris]|uniref:helix-turn-helix domain-containing protein n=1 Tax=Fulvivirga lutimaris TaxID=1819566 RepID=UPI0012BB91DB|nr:helix-turn-helix domain-containing protein [Fulvivirga lutimaris]MTI40855.1 AraC family transcriptional regulator [Fulvivirga lutimaris]
MQLAGVNIWMLIFWLAAGQGLFLSAIIFSRKSKISNLLAGVVLSFSLMLIYYITFWTGLYQSLPRVIGISGAFTFIFPPLLWFYIKSGKGKLYFKPIHFLPFLLYCIYFGAAPSLGHEQRMTAGLTVAIVQNIHLMIYSLLIFKTAIKQSSVSKEALWKKNIAWSFIGYTLSFNLYYLLVWTGALKIEYDYFISLASSFFIYYVGYYSHKNPSTLKSLEGLKYEKTQIGSTASHSIFESIKKHMEIEKPFLNSELKLNLLAEQLSLSVNQVSQVINDITGQNFSDFINQYRIEEAKRIITNDDQNLKLIEVAYDSGFNNKTSFNNAFKKFTSYSPSEFQQMNRKKLIA